MAWRRLVVARQLGQLCKADAGVDIGHAEVVAEHVVVVAHLHAVLAQQVNPFGERGVGGGDHAALTGGHVLGRIEAERAGTPRSAEAAVDRGAVRLRRVLDDLQAMAFGDLDDGRQIRGVAVQADRHDCPGARRDGGLDQRGIHVEAGLVDIDEDGARAGVQDRVGAGDEGERHGDDLIAGADAVAQQRQVQRRRAGAGGNRVRHAHQSGEALLEFTDAGALGQRSRL